MSEFSHPVTLSDVRVNETEPNEQRVASTRQSIAMQSDGQAIVVWRSVSLVEEESVAGIFARRLDVNGQPAGAEFQVNQTAIASQDQRNAAVAIDGSGNLIVVWETFSLTSGSNIVARRFNADGTSGNEFLVNLPDDALRVPFNQELPSIAIRDNGEFVVTWTSRNQESRDAEELGSSGIFARRFQADGTPIADEFQVNVTTANDQRNSSVAIDANGNFVVAWTSQGQVSGADVFFRRFDAEGRPLDSAEVLINSQTAGDQQDVRIAIAADNSFVLTWASTGGAVFARQFNADGTPKGNEFLVSRSGSAAPAPSVAIDATGGFVITWVRTDQRGNRDIFAKRFSREGIPQNQEFQVNATLNGVQQDAAIAIDRAGDAAIVWSDVNSADVESRRFNLGDLPTTIGIADRTQLDTDGNLTIDLTAAFADRQTAAADLTYRVVQVGNSALFQDGAPNIANGILTLDFVREIPGESDITIRATDASGFSVETTFKVTRTPSDLPPSLIQTTRSIAYAEDADPVQLDTALQVTDDGSILVRATVTIENFQTGDSLSVDLDAARELGLIVTSSSNGLTIEGAASPSQYQALLRTLAYRTTSQNPVEGDRTIRLQVNDGDQESNVATWTIAITPTNDAPVVSLAAARLTYTEGDEPLAIDALLAVEDVDSLQLNRATVTIANNFVADQDVLSVDTDLAADLGLVVTNENGVLTLSGQATIAEYQAILRSVTFSNTSENPTVGDRTIRIVVSDGLRDSELRDRSIRVQPQNSAPVVTVTNTPVTFTEDQTAISIDPNLTITDDGLQLTGASVEITNFAPGDRLDVIIPNGSPVSSAFENGGLTLSGAASLADYQAILRSLTFRNDTQNPTGGDRTIRILVRDSLTESAAVDRTIAVQPVNDAPTVTPNGAVAYRENDLPIAIANDLLLADVDSLELASATIRITNFVAGQDELLFTANHGITGSFSGDTLTLSGRATIAQYQDMLRSVTYRNTSDNPNLTTRSIEFRVNDGSASSNVVTRTVSIAAVNDAPRLTFSSPAPTYIENAASILVDANLTLSDPDSTTIASVTIEMTDGVSGQDFLDATVSGNISKRFENNVLTLTGEATIAQYQTILRSITYSNSSDNPGTVRNLRFTISDGVDRTVVDRSININAINDAPVVTTSSGAVSFTEGTSPAVVDDNVTLSDPDNTTLVSATVTIRNYQDGEDLLSVANANGLAIEYRNGVLTLTGTATIAQYQAALRSIAYSNSSNNPNSTPRILEFRVNDGQTESAIRTRTVNVFGANDAPTLAISGSAAAFRENGTAVAIAPNLTVSDTDSATLTGATITLLNATAQELLNFTAQNGITGTYRNGVLTLTGEATIAQYQAALRSITYSNASDDPDLSRTIQLSVTDGNRSSSIVSQTVQVEAVNDPPTIAGSSGRIIYLENNPGLIIDGELQLGDLDNATLNGAIVRISSNYAADQDFLRFTNQNGITGEYRNGVLTLIGTASLADYQIALRSITYFNSSENPNLSDRTIEFTISDGQAEATRSRTIQVVGTPDAPIVTVSDSPLSYAEGQAAVAIDAAIDLSDVDSATLQSATIRITNFSAGDLLDFTAPDGFRTSFSQGVLTIAGSGSIEQYESFLRSITYRNDNPNLSAVPRSIEFTVSDGTLSSSPVTRPINITTIDSPPVLTGSAAIVSYREAGLAAAIDPGLTLTDADSDSIASATVTLINALPEDRLNFTNQNGITGDYRNGVLTLTGTATIAQYQAALRSITYSNLSENPNPTSRRIAIVVNDGRQTSNSIERTVLIEPVNDAPIVTVSTDAVSFLEGGSPVVIDGGVTIADVDSQMIDRAVVTITNFVEGQDVLSFTASGTISGEFNSQTGVLTLSGTAAIADYQAALQQITYRNTSSNPNAGDRLIRLTVTDSDQATSLAATRRVTIATLNSPPTISPESGALTYAEDAPAILLAPTVTLTDRDSQTLDRATITLSDFNADDILSFTNQSGITGTYSNGVLTLSGTASIAQYQTALRSITYRTTSNTPIDTARSIEILVNDGNRDSAPVTRSLTIRPTNDAPIVTTTAGSTAYSGTAVAIDPTIEIRDVDSSTLTGATVRIRNYLRIAQDQLSFTPQTNITGSFDSNTGSLRLSGTASIADYEAALRSITYRSLNSLIAGDRQIEFSVNDGQATSAFALRNLQIVRLRPASPQITLAATPLTYTENQPAVAIDSSLSLREGSSLTLDRATVRLIGYVAAEDVLTFTQQNGITGRFDRTTGTLNLRGSASIAAYEAALRSISYLNRSENPNATDRSIEISVGDSSSTSAPVTRSLRVVAVNDAPQLSLSTEPLVFAPSTGAVSIAAGLSISDVDSANLSEATVTIEGFSPQDQLSFTNQNGITGQYQNGVLTLSGTASIAQYQAAIASITFRNSAPNGTTRTLRLRVTDGITPSSEISRPLRVVTNNRAPVLDLNGTAPGTGFTATYRLGTPPVRIVSPQLSLADVDSSTIASAVVAIANPLDWRNERLDVVTAGTSITAEYNAAGGRLTLIGVANRSTYEQVLRSITYSHSGSTADVTPRQIVFTVNDGDFSSNIVTSRVSLFVPVIEPNPRVGTPEDDDLVTTPRTDTIDALEGDDFIVSTLANLQQNDLINGGAGRDTLVITEGTGALVLNLNNSTRPLTGAIDPRTRIFNIERFDLRQFGGSTTQTGTSRSDVLIGAIGSNRFRAGAGNDVILGNVGSDFLDGGTGGDILTGGAGNDRYRVDNRGDRVIEVTPAGVDSVESAIDYTLGLNLENLTLTGQARRGRGNAAHNRIVGNSFANSIAGAAGNDILLGNSGDDRLTGDAGDDLLNGGGGRDRLTGGVGRDTFTLGLSRSSQDGIADFNAVDDTIAISIGRVPGITIGRLSTRQFVLGQSARDADDRFIYSQATGALFYDADGLGRQAAVQIATIENRSRLTAADIFIA